MNKKLRNVGSILGILSLSLTGGTSSISRVNAYGPENCKMYMWKKEHEKGNDNNSSIYYLLTLIPIISIFGCGCGYGYFVYKLCNNIYNRIHDQFQILSVKELKSIEKKLIKTTDSIRKSINQDKKNYKTKQQEKDEKDLQSVLSALNASPSPLPWHVVSYVMSVYYQLCTLQTRNWSDEQLKTKNVTDLSSEIQDFIKNYLDPRRIDVTFDDDDYLRHMAVALSSLSGGISKEKINAASDFKDRNLVISLAFFSFFEEDELPSEILKIKNNYISSLSERSKDPNDLRLKADLASLKNLVSNNKYSQIVNLMGTQNGQFS